MSFLCNSSPRCVHAGCTISTCLCRMHSQPEHLVNFILFFPFNFSAPPFFSFQFFHSFFFYSYLRSIFLLVHVFFEWNITGRVQNTQQFSQLFFPNYTIVNLLFKTCKSLSMIIYFNDSSDLQTRAIFFFSSFPPLLYLVAVSL